MMGFLSQSCEHWYGKFDIIVLSLTTRCILISQALFHSQLSAFDKVVLVNALFRLNMIRGKTIIFVNSVDKGYRYVVICISLIITDRLQF